MGRWESWTSIENIRTLLGFALLGMVVVYCYFHFDMGARSRTPQPQCTTEECVLRGEDDSSGNYRAGPGGR